MFFTVADSSLVKLLDRVDPDFLGVIGILAVVMAFVFSIVFVVTVTRTIQNITLARMHRKLINELLDRGYAVNDIQQLLNGRQQGVLARFFDGRGQKYVTTRRPSPPVKTYS